MEQFLNFVFDSWVKINNHILDFTCPNLGDSVNHPLEAAILAVNDIVSSYPPPYILFASGGIDSQAMLYAWKKSGHPFEVYTFSYNQNYNWHDIQTLPKFCEQEDIEYKVIDIDYFSFLENEYDAIARRYHCSSPQIAMHIKMASYFKDSTCVYSGNPLSINHAHLTYAIMGLYRFSKTNEGKNIIPYFFLHTPELAYSFLTVATHESNILGGYEAKTQLYLDSKFPVIPQEQKFTGFEKFKEHYDSHTYVLKDINKRKRYYMKPSHRPFDWIFRYPYEDLFNDKPLTFILNPLTKITG